MTFGHLYALIVCLAPIAASRADAPKPPHVIFVLADDLGPGDLGISGGTLATTPNLDRMAKDGIHFTHYYTAAPICSPSRCGLITGHFPARWRLTSYLQTRAGNQACGQADFLDPRAPSLPRVLSDIGYRTAHFGKWHLGGGRDVADAPRFASYGYHEHASTWESPEPHPDITAANAIWSDKDKTKRWERSAFFVDKTLDFLARHKDGPCFVNLWLDDPHTPWVPNPAAGRGASTAPNLKTVMEEVDRQIGRLREGLRALGIDRDTLLIFTSDNGPLPTLDGRRSGGLRGSKLSLYEGGIRVPLLAVWPGTIPAGTTDDITVFGAVDVLPTVCKLAGAELPGNLRPDGEDRSPALLGTSQPERARPLFWEYGRNDTSFDYPTARNGARPGDRSPNFAVRDGHWKLLVNADGTGAELYDVSTDPAETKDLAATEPEQLTRLTKLILEWRNSLP